MEEQPEEPTEEPAPAYERLPDIPGSNQPDPALSTDEELPF